MYNSEDDVIAGDANAAAYKFFKKQEYQDLYNSQVVIMLREKHREVNEGRPFESRLLIDYANKNHSFHIRSASDLDCCFMGILSGRKPPGPIIMRTLLEQLAWANECRSTRKDKTKTARTTWALKSCSRRRAKRTSFTQRTSTIPWLRLKIVIFVNLNEFQSSNQRFSDTTNRTVLALSNTCDHSWDALKNYRGRSSEKSNLRENKIEEAKKQKTKRSDDKWVVPMTNII